MFFLAGPLLFVLTSLPLYLDPSSGSILLQLLIAGLAGAGLFISMSWKRIKRFFGRKVENETEDDDDGDEEEIDKPRSTKLSVHLPAKCPTCGTAVRPNEVKRLDDVTVECQYCGMPIKVHQK
ncbi:MAG: hypothetical protein FD146_1832 [Anaerolineaceae bacterium]|nr:MAG: hypothetical protein FD146_1832 [Anaerolineaceae bacterium]